MGSASYYGFSAGGYYDKKHNSSVQNIDTTHLSVSFCYQRVAIYRRWLNGDLLATKNWYVPSRRRGFYSSGKKDRGNMNNTWPWTPDSFIVAKQINICNQWSSNDKAHIIDSLAHGAHAGFNCGFFSASAKYDAANGHDGVTNQATFDGTCIKVPGAQVIAWMGSINGGGDVEEAGWPPLDDPRLSKE